MSSVFIVDDHPVIRLALRMVLEDAGFDIVGETDNGVDALQMVREIDPDLVILDIVLSKLDGLEVLARLRAMETKVKILVLTARPPLHFARRCITSGAAGYVCKQEDTSELISATRAVLAGYHYFPIQVLAPEQNNGVSRYEFELFKAVNDRELMVLQLFAQGRTNHEIAHSMFISNKTVSAYKKRLMRKLRITSPVELIEVAKRQCLV